MYLTTALPRVPAWRLGLQFAHLALAELPRRLASATGMRRRARVGTEELQLPDSQLCRRATAMVVAASPLFLLNHGVRSFVFGAALGRRDGRRFDPELLYLSCVMHDLGLTPQHDTAAAFELDGARAAHRFLIDQGVDEQRAALVHEAIALHARVGEAQRGSVEGALTQLGAGVDVMGLRWYDFAPQDMGAVVAAWPRAQFKRDFVPLLRDQAQRKPHCNIAGHVGIGFLDRIAGAPFAE
jgi:hypothetical protein